MEQVNAVVLLFVLSLLGCSTPQQRAESLARAQAEQEAQQRAYAQRLRTTCSSYGFTQGTDAFANCIRAEHQQAQRCANIRNELALRFNLNLMEEGSRPGAYAGETMGRAAARTPSPRDYVRIPDQRDRCFRANVTGHSGAT